jgi:hypothetical protein
VPVYTGGVTDISNRLLVAEPNADNIEGFSFDFGNNKCIFHLWDHRGLHRVDVRLTDCVRVRLPSLVPCLHYGYEPSTLIVVAGGRWILSNTFEMTWQFIEKAFQDNLAIRILDNKGAVFSVVHTAVWNRVSKTLCSVDLNFSPIQIW